MKTSKSNASKQSQLQEEMRVNTARQLHYKLEDLMREMPAQFPLLEEWDVMQPVGKEIV